ncbi:MAG: hypothetical protein GX146_04365 [Myxococcales bacterium]|nr:hypothetical protein [Myxococcales bacterium]
MPHAPRRRRHTPALPRPSRLSRLPLLLPLLLALLGTSLGCNESFEAFTTVSDLRLLGIAATPPDLHSGDAAQLTALVVQSPTDARPLSYHWRWCPVGADAQGHTDCPISQAQFDDLLRTAGLDPRDTFAPFDLGDAPEATLGHTLPAAALRALCTLAFSQAAPTFMSLPRCAHSLPITVTLDVTDGDKTIRATKKIRLLTDDALPPNANPRFGTRITATDSDGRTITLRPDAPTTLAGHRTWRIRVDIPEDASESFVPLPDDDGDSGATAPDPVREILFMTWFVGGGEMKFSRTGFYDGATPFDDLRHNEWTAPKAADAPDVVPLYWVLQDERGGVAWTSRDIVLAEETP